MRIYEINTWSWLSELSDRSGRSVTLGTVPGAEWDTIGTFGFDAVWLMGVWKRSAAGKVIAESTQHVLMEAVKACPGFRKSRDIVGSPYCIADYTVDEHLGGAEGLAIARQELSGRGMKLILDFVPNHTSQDHPWITQNPEYYVQLSDDDELQDSGRFFRTVDNAIIAYGAPSDNVADRWSDTAQLNVFSQKMRTAAVHTVNEIAKQCDGIRCDMAMLLLTDLFARTWGKVAGAPLEGEYWKLLIDSVRECHHEFVFIAESYCDTEWQLWQLGFDFCYDKNGFYDDLASGDTESLRRHLEGASPEFQKHLVRFIENHDEPPASEVFKPPEKVWMAAVAAATLPGASIWYANQFEGVWGRQPVQLGYPTTYRRFYRWLLQITNRPAIQQGTWSLCSVGNSSSMFAWCWENDDDRVLIVLNMSEDISDCWGHIAVPWKFLKGQQWKLIDVYNGEMFVPRNGDDMEAGRLLIQSRCWGINIFEVKKLDE